MTARTGLGILEVAVLTSVALVRGTSTRVGIPAGFGDTYRVLEVLESELAVGPRYSYLLVQDLAVPWRLHLPLLAPIGNWGSQHGDPAADARYTELGLTPAGELALAAERGEVGPVPLGLIEGSLYRAGAVPPFAPARVVAALLAGRSDAGPPAMPTGGTVEGEVDALLAGRPARLRLGCTVTREPGRLVITQVPLGVQVDLLVHQLKSACGGTTTPITRVDDCGEWGAVRVVCRLAPGADVDQALEWLRQVWSVTIDVDCLLPSPMQHRLRTWDRGDGSGLAALSTLIHGPRPSTAGDVGGPW